MPAHTAGTANTSAVGDLDMRTRLCAEFCGTILDVIKSSDDSHQCGAQLLGNNASRSNISLQSVQLNFPQQIPTVFLQITPQCKLTTFGIRKLGQLL
jgi:hypothetical protein